MHEILDHLGSDAVVLDLGSGSGSFRAGSYPFRCVRVDLLRPTEAPAQFVQADAAKLPFRSRTFDAIVLNHCLEHVEALKPTLQEIGRVVKRDGGIFVSVPDAHTFTDRVYRKVARDRGGHVNLFGSSAGLEKMLSWYFGLPHVATRTLHSGLTFLNRTNVRRSSHIRAQMRFGGFPEWALALINLGLRTADRRFQTRLSVYGWGMYFGTVGEPVDRRELVNVCLRCGDGRRLSEVRAGDSGGAYRCPGCGARNLGISDRTR